MKKEIFDFNGNKVNIEDLLFEITKEAAEKHNLDIDDIYIQVTENKQKKFISISTTEDNRYDGINLIELD